ncbi:C1 family peptidase [Methanobrevibacter sp.]|uniref:C1 family peptidase n=1 Tax=Methanobrevibacter sp. TaxID=66852 RepID=UPI00389041CF
MLRLNKLIILIALLLLLCVTIPNAFALDNETVLSEDIVHNSDIASVYVEDDVLKASNDYYFNASAEEDGDGSASNPYKYLTSDRIHANANLYLADGEYELDTAKNIERVNIYGTNPQKTVISYPGVGFTVSTYLSIHNVTFMDMSITNHGMLTAENSVFSYAVGSRYDSYGNNFGGAIYTPQDFPNAVVQLKNCTFLENYAVYGGAIYMGSGALDISDSVFINNLAYNFGGAIACENTGNVSISKSRFYNSESINDAGGAVYIRESSLTVKDTDFINSSATFGSAITSLKTSMNLNNIYAENNTASWDGGAIYHMYGDFSLTSSKFINNSARNGGALFVDNSTSLLLRMNNFFDNHAINCGGAVYSVLNKLKIPIVAYNFYKDNHAYFSDNVFDTSLINLSIGNSNYTMYKVTPQQITALPSYFNLYDEGLTTTVKDQESSSNCWAFTAIAVLESCILKAGGENLDLSEENMKNLMACYSDYGWILNTNDGGYDYMPWGYLTSWLGPVSEMEDLLDDKSILSPVLNSIAHVQNIMFLKRDNYTDNDAIKKALMQYGAVGTGMAYYSNYYDASTNGYYCFSNVATNHEVTIVGWDDNYSRSNFKWGSSIPGDGAWIVRNSWGPSWGENGYFYVSYYDTKFAQPGIYDASYTIIFNDTIRYDKNYQYDIPGESDFFLNESSSIWYKNVFTASDDEYLAAVSTYFMNLTNWTVSIYVNDNLVLRQDGSSNPGYYTIDLDENIPLKIGDIFEVVFNVMVKGNAGFPISEAVNFNKVMYKPGISYTSVDGKNWQDLFNLNWQYSGHNYASQVACIKAFTFLSEITTILNLSVDQAESDIRNVTATVMDQYGNMVKSGVVTFNIDEENYDVDVLNGVAVLPYHFLNLFNDVYAIFEGDGYASSMNYTSVEVEKSDIDVDLNVIKTLNNVTLEFIANDKINAEAVLTINDSEQSIQFENGNSSIDLSDLDYGIYNVCLNMIFPINSIYVNKTLNYSFSIDIKKTRIVADNLVINDDDAIDYNVTLLDWQGVALSNKSIEFILNGNSYNSTTDVNGQAVMPIHLNPGNYDLDITFSGDNDYLSSEISSDIKVKTKVDFDLNVERQANNVSLIIGLSKNVTDALTVIINNKTQQLEAISGSAVVNLSDLENNVYNVTLCLNPDEYDFNTFESQFVVDVKNTLILADDLTAVEDEPINYTVFLTDDDGIPLSNRTVEFKINGNAHSVQTDENGQVVLPITLPSGEYDVEVAFNGDDNHFKSANLTKINIKMNVEIHYSTDSFGNNVTIGIYLSKLINGTAFIKVDNVIHEIDIMDGVAVLDLYNLDNGNYDFTCYLDENVYESEPVSGNFTVDVKASQFIGDDFTCLDDGSGIYTIKLTDIDANPISNQQVSVTVNNLSGSYISDENGDIFIPIKLTGGVYDLIADFEGSTNYFKTSKTFNITVKTKIDLEIEVVQIFDSIHLFINASEIIGENLTVKINEKTYPVLLDNLKCFLLVNNLSNGKYDLNVSLDSDLYYCDNISEEFTINMADTRIIADNLNTYSQSGAEYKIKLVDINNNPLNDENVVFKLNGRMYIRTTDDNGVASIIVNLTDGEYPIEIDYGGLANSYFGCNSSHMINVMTSVITNDSAVRTADSYSVKLLDIDGSPLSNKEVSYSLDGIDYNASTDENGVLNIKLPQKPGTYVFTFINPVNGQVLCENITVYPKITNNKNIAIYAFSGTKFRVLILNDEGKPVGAGKIVSMKIAGKTHNVKTDKKGYAALAIKLKSGKYTITTTYGGYKVSNKITVKPVLTAKNISKKKAKSYKFKAKLVNSKGKPLKGKKITFKIKGKKYVAKTNKKGVATITIKLKLKVGSYKIYSFYGKSKIKNTIKIKK